MLRLISAIAVLVCCTASAAAKSLALKQGRSTPLPDLEIRFRPFADFDLVPIPTPDIIRYRNTTTGDEIEAYAPVALWRRDQSWVRFSGPVGRISIARLTTAFPDELPLINNQHVRQADYDAQQQPETLVQWDETAINHWVAAFCGREIQAVRPTARTSPDYLTTRYEFTDIPADELQGYLLVSKKQPVQRLFIMFEFASGLELRRRDVATMRSVLSVRRQRTANSPSTAPERSFQNRQTANSDVRGKGHDQQRQAVIDNIKNLKDWWYVETPNYVLTSNLTAAHRQLVKRIQRDIEALRRGYAKLFPAWSDNHEVSVIRVFNERKEYLAYVNRAMHWSGGVWIPYKKELVVSGFNARGRTEKRERVLQVVYHEGFHQYLYYALNKRPLPIWINEGHACMFEGMKIQRNGKALRLYENARLARRLETLLEAESAVSVRELMSMNRRQFHVIGQGNTDAQAVRIANYTMAWALVYFLRKAGPLYTNRPYATLFDTVITAFRESGGNTKVAQRAALDAVDMDQLERDFVDFWTSSSKRSRAERHRLFK